MYIVVDIGGTKTLVTSFDGTGAMAPPVRFETNPDYPAFLQTLQATAAPFLTTKPVKACVAFPGVVDIATGTAKAGGNIGWQNIPFQADMERILGCPVAIANDAKLAGLSEALLVREQYRKVLYLTIGTGIGNALIIDGQLDPDFDASEAGQMMLEHDGKVQKWESFASGKAIAQLFGKPARDITEQKDWDIIGRNIAAGLIDLLAVLQPEIVIIGGGIGKYFAHYSLALTSHLKEFETPLLPIPPIVMAQHPEEAVLYGGYAYLHDQPA